MNGREGLRELRDAARASWRPWAFFALAAIVATAAFHGRQIRIDDDGGVSWGGTLGGESMFHAALSGALLRGETDWPVGDFGASGRIRYHIFSHLLAGAASRWGGIGVIEIYARSLPVVLFTFAFAAHRWLLRTWFPASWTLSAAALLPLLVTDFTPWARFFGLGAADAYENRTGHSFVVSPSFVAGQAFACIAIGLAVRLGHLGAHVPRLAVVGSGVLLGSIIGWKLPSAVIAAIAVGALLPWLRAKNGTRATVVAVVTALLWALVTQRVCWGTGFGESSPSLARSDRWLDDIAAEPALLGSAVLWPFLVLGARCLRPRAFMAMLREDATLGAVLAATAAGLVGVLLLRIPPYDEEKYLLRCGTYPLLLVVGALIFRDLASLGGRRWWGVYSCGILAMTCVWQVREVVRAEQTTSALTGAEIQTLRRSAQSGELRIGPHRRQPPCPRYSAWSAAAGCALLLKPRPRDAPLAILMRRDFDRGMSVGDDLQFLEIVFRPSPGAPSTSPDAVSFEVTFLGPNLVIYTRVPETPR